MVAPYKRTGLMTSSFQGSRGAALTEGIRSADALTSQLSQMSNFFFNQAAEQRRIEGEEFGAANAPTYEELVKAEKEGKNLLDFAPTVYGRSAKAAALATVENEIILDSAERFDNLVFQATKNMVSPNVLKNDLNAAILGYGNILEATNPVLARKMNLKLSLNANTLFDAYRKKYLTSILASNSKSNATGVDVQLNSDVRNFDNWLQNNVLTRETVFNEISLKNNQYRALLVASGYKKTNLQNKLEEHLKSLNDAAQAFVVQTVLDNGAGSKAEISEGIRNGFIPTGGNLRLEKINQMLDYFTREDRLAISKAVTDTANSQINIENNELNAAQEESKRVVTVLEKEAAELLNTDNRQIDVAKIESIINQIEATGADTALDVANNLRKTLADTGGETASETGLVEKIQSRQASLNFEYSDLVKERKNLNITEYTKLLNEQKKIEKEEYKEALRSIAASLNITSDDFGRIDPGSTASEANRELFMEAKKLLDQEFRKAVQSTASGDPADVIDFNGQDIADRYVYEDREQHKKIQYNNSRSTLLRVLKDIKFIRTLGYDFDRLADKAKEEGGTALPEGYRDKPNIINAIDGIKNGDMTTDLTPLIELIELLDQGSIKNKEIEEMMFRIKLNLKKMKDASG
tara:strand:+ start:2915 stop:4825 length:1911 start_codon:yes stop_codon:yes gene_type:complete